MRAAFARCVRAHAALWLLLLALFAATLQGALAHAQDAEQDQVIRSAVLSSAAGERVVTLPHILEKRDFDPQGSRVRYRLIAPLSGPPTQEPLAIYVPKMSLAGQVTLNGADVGRCAAGPLDRIRCLHHPQLFIPHRPLWKAGENVIEFEVFANARQVNGLSAVTVGNAAQLAEGPYALGEFLQVELRRGLAWAMICLGVVSLALALMFRETSGFGWFGIATLLGAVCHLNLLIEKPLVSVDFFYWFLFSTRLVSAQFSILTALVFFSQDTPFRKRFLLGSAVVAPILVLAVDFDLRVIGALYMIYLALSLLLFFAIFRWAWLSRRRRHVLGCLAFLPTVGAALYDWTKLTGVSNFEGAFLFTYANAVTMILLAGIIIATIADALERSRRSSLLLRERVRKKEAELRVWYAERSVLERNTARYEEREHLLRDMHDGIGSSLSSARILLRSGRLSAGEAAEVLQECSDDLRLMIDASGNPEGSLESAVADFRYRLDQRIDPADLSLEWHIALADMPPMSTDDLLQVMRIMQEACNNAIRHARGARLEIRATWDAGSDELDVSVRDDGCGIQGSFGFARGMGLQNMHRRAAALGARLEIEDASPGTSVRLRMKLCRSTR